MLKKDKFKYYFDVNFYVDFDSGISLFRGVIGPGCV